MASMAMADLPVERSPMINSRWPRPMGIMESMALMPVCTRSVDGLADDDVGRHLLDRPGGGGVDRTFTVEGAAQGVDDAANQGIADGDFNNLAGGADPVAFFDHVGVAEDGRAHEVGLQVHGQAEDVVAEVQKLVGADALEALDAGDTVADLDHGTDVDEG